MTPAEIAVLNALIPHRISTAAQIRCAARLTSWRTRQALAQLESRGLIIPSRPRGRWRISDRGRIAFAVKARRFG